MKFKIVSNSEDETKTIAKTIAPFFQNGDILLLDGDLGAGKTHFVKGFAEGLGSKDLVTSPTFSIANFYSAKESELLHIDLYRISTIDEFIDLGLSDYFSQNVVLIEWGIKFSVCFDEYFIVFIEYDENIKDTRKITFSYYGEKYNSIINLISKKLPNIHQC